MTYAYEASVSYQEEDGGWLITFDDFDGATAFGSDLPAAFASASTTLRLLIAERLDEREALPVPTFHTPPCSVVSVDVDAAYRVRTRCITISQAAEDLGVSVGRVSQLLDSGQLDAVELGGRRYVTIASIERRKAHPPAPHRPRKTVSQIVAR